MKKALLINQFNSDNLGDKLLNARVKAALEQKGYCVSNIGFAQQTAQGISETATGGMRLANYIKKLIPPKIKYLLKYKKDLEKTIRNINSIHYDFLIIGGGQLIKHNSVFMYCFDFWCNYAQKNNIPLVIYGVGVDSNLNQYEINFYKHCLKNSCYVNCRDNETQRKFKKLFEISAEISPDIAFTTPRPKNTCVRDSIILMPYSYSSARHHFGFSKSRAEYYADFLNIVNANKNLNIIITSTTSIDIEECRHLKQFLETHNIQCKISIVKTADQLLNLFLKSKIVVTGRMHAMIAGLVCECHVVPIKVSRKIEVFSEEYLTNNCNLGKTAQESANGINKMLLSVNTKQQYELTISIVIPTKDRVKYIEKAIESIVTQEGDITYEIVIIDDCSTQKHIKKLKDLIKRHKNIDIKLIENHRALFASESRKEGFKASRGKYIIFMDDDDFYLDKTFFRKSTDIMEKDNSISAVVGATISYENNKFHNKKDLNGSGKISNIEYMSDFMNKYTKPDSTLSMVVRRDILKQYNLDKSKMVNDTCLYLYAILGGNIFLINEAVAAYRIHGGNISNKRFGMKFIFNCLNEKKKIYKIVCDKMRIIDSGNWYLKQLEISSHYFIASSNFNPHTIFAIMSWMIICGNGIRKKFFSSLIAKYKDRRETLRK